MDEDDIDDMYATGILNQSRAEDVRNAFEDDVLAAGASKELVDIAGRSNDMQVGATNRKYEAHLKKLEERHALVVQQARVVAHAARDAAAQVKN